MNVNISEYRWMYQYQKITEEECVELIRAGGPSLLNVASLDNDVYASDGVGPAPHPGPLLSLFG